jgi:hypothetical protein
MAIPAFSKSQHSQPTQSPFSSASEESAIRFVCISDTHNAKPSVPPGDVLIHAGDLTQHGTKDELTAAILWISTLPHVIKIVIAGNHDKVLDPKYRSSELLDDPRVDWESAGIIYLDHASTQIELRGRTFTVFGSPWTPEFGAWAFQYPPPHLIPEPARRIWSAIPLNTDILITHGPPFGHLDATKNEHVGCRELLRRVEVVKPTLHVFGHIHAGQGRETVVWDNNQSGLEFDARRQIKRLFSFMRGAQREVVNKETLLINASIQPGSRDAPLNDPEIVYL